MARSGIISRNGFRDWAARIANDNRVWSQIRRKGKRGTASNPAPRAAPAAPKPSKKETALRDRYNGLIKIVALPAHLRRWEDIALLPDTEKEALASAFERELKEFADNSEAPMERRRLIETFLESKGLSVQELRQSRNYFPRFMVRANATPGEGSIASAVSSTDAPMM
jgi:hypothetical protein